ncbi:MAG: WYL domain-containing protein [Leptonema sp. (in: bacteria)]
MASLSNLEKILTSIPVLIKIAEKNNNQIPIKSLVKILKLKSQKEAISLVNHLCMITNNIFGSPLNFFNIYYEDNFIYLDNNSYLSFDRIRFPLNKKDMENLYEILRDDPNFFNALLKKFQFEDIIDIDYNSYKDKIKIFEEGIQKKNQIIFLYKKLESAFLEQKKIIPIQIENMYNSYYILGYDLKEKSDSKYKIYKLDRVIQILKVLEYQNKIQFDSINREFFLEFIKKTNKPEIEIVFAYHPNIELNLRNYLDFHTIEGSIEIENLTWKIAKVKTKFPEYFFEKSIYFAKWIYILKPEDLNLKIKKHFEKILEFI